MVCSDLTLSRRLERAEGHACVQFAAAHRRAFPDCGAEWIRYAGADVVFDGVDSPVTQTFGLGLFEELTTSTLDVIETFFRERGSPVFHEVSPLAGVAAVNILCARGYRPVEISSVLYETLTKPTSPIDGGIRVRLPEPEENELWAAISARGWANEHPEFLDFILRTSSIASAREDSLCFLAELDGQPGAAGSLCIHNGVGLLGGSATVPEMRRRGLQAALIQERLRYAFEHGCDLAMMVAETGGESQRNAERRGFQIAYTRTKWRLPFEALSTSA